MLIGTVVGLGLSVAAFFSFYSDKTATVTNDIDNFSVSRPSVRADEDLLNLSSLNEYESGFFKDVTLFLHLSDANIEQAVSLFKQSQELNFRSVSLKSNIQTVVVRRLATIDPKFALNLVEAIPLGQRDLLLSEIFREWAVFDLVSAIKYALDMDGWSKQIAAKSLISTRDDLSNDKRLEIASLLGVELLGGTILSMERVEHYMDTPEKAWHLIIDDDISDEFQHKTLMQIAKNWVQNDGLEVITQLIDFNTGWNDHYWIAEAVIAYEIGNNPRGAFQYASELPPTHDWGIDISLGIRSGAVREWAKADPIMALDAISQVDNISETERAQLVGALVESWANIDPRGILTNIELIPNHAHEQVKSQTAMALLHEDHQAAMNLMKGMTEGMPKLLTAGMLVSEWGATDADAAYDWVMSDSEIQNMRYKLLEITLQAIARTDPRRAWGLALQHLQDHSSQEVLGLDIIVVSSIAQQDVDLALELLSQVSEASRQIAFREVAKILVANQEYAKALDAAADLPENQRSGYYESIVKQWAQSDPESLFESIRELPSPEVRSQAAFSLHLNAWQGALTDRQMKQLRRFLTREDSQLLKQVQ